MKTKSFILPAVLLAGSLIFGGCQNRSNTAGGSGQDGSKAPAESITPAADGADLSGYLRIADDFTDDVDPQCTTSLYTVALNIFDRLVEVESDPENGSSRIVPSLADSWEISEDGLIYIFHLHPGVMFSNGSPLTSSDVEYTFKRLLTLPDSVNQDIASSILGADRLQNNETDILEGFDIINDETFSITLEQPYAAFLACLSTPGASILDKETTEEAGDTFGIDPAMTVGTGPFIFDRSVPESYMLLSANKDCWSGPPMCDGIRINLVDDGESLILMYKEGELDILDLEELGSEAEFYIHGDIYQDSLVKGSRVGITYIALNQSVPPLDNALVRKALQMGLDRRMILQASCSGRGYVENGIFPHGLIGFNPDLEEIPYDPEGARELLREAGYPDGFSLDISMEEGTSEAHRELSNIIASMWEEIGVKTHVYELDDNTFMTMRRSGSIACYVCTWSADFNDPDNFIYTFFGSEENSKSRSLCFEDEELISRVHKARSIISEEERLREYNELEKIIVQDMACWVPLYSQQHIFALSSRVEGFEVSWNGWSSNRYRNVSVTGRN